ncbi:MAG: FecR family protein [Arachidicoccus sp.]|nr:FecR family protein [Arachidicoccus sp.]
MNQKDTHIWELIAKKICGEADENELTSLDVLLDSENKLHTLHILSVLEKYWKNLNETNDEAGMENKSVVFLKKVSREIHSGNLFEHIQPIHKSFFTVSRVWKVAAAVIIFIGIGFGIKYLNKSELTKIVSGANTRKMLALPDGTKVWLNSGSSISYSKKYLQSESREINLIGEAYFEVKHNAKHPFIIHTPYSIDIEDLGTTFNVKAYPSDSSMETTLLKGAVEIYVAKTPNQKLLLQPKQKFVYKKSSNNIKDMLSLNAVVSSGSLDDNSFAVVNIGQIKDKKGDSLVSETAWMQNQLAFIAEPFSQLATRMSKWYNIKINIEDSAVASYRFSGVFEGETVTQALNELQLIRAFKYKTHNEGNIIITR